MAQRLMNFGSRMATAVPGLTVKAAAASKGMSKLVYTSQNLQE